MSESFDFQRDSLSFEKIRERAERARLEKLSQAREEGKSVEELPIEFEVSKNEQNYQALFGHTWPTEEELKARAEEVRKAWDKKTERERLGALAPSHVELSEARDRKSVV